MKKLIAGLALLTLSTALSCSGTGGTETGNPATITDFASSSCKNEQSDPGPQALTLASDAEGLTCVEWSTTDSKLKLRLSNFAEGCGDEYFGAAKLNAAGALELHVFKDICAVAACGSCVFDFDFEVSGVPLDAPLPLRIGHAVCASEPVTFTDELTLPLDEQDRGIACQYMRSGDLVWYASARRSCGERNMPCGDCNEDLNTCNAGLQCTQLGERDQRCLTTCSSNDDCLADMTFCQDGVCQANASF